MGPSPEDKVQKKKNPKAGTKLFQLLLQPAPPDNPHCYNGGEEGETSSLILSFYPYICQRECTCEEPLLPCGVAS